jgi:hypothetical protein
MNTIKGSDALKVAQEALTNTDKEKFPKLYESREATVKALEVAQNQKVRAEKSEKAAKAAQAPQEKKTLKNKGEETPKNYSLQDIRALNDVHDDDVDTVTDWAKFKNISVAEAKKSSEMQTILRERKEERETAGAANTGGGKKRGTSKTSGKSLLKEFEKTGEVPESDTELRELAEADMEAKVQESKSRRS